MTDLPPTGVDEIAVGKCSNCGYIYGDDLDYRFPEPSECQHCGQSTKKTAVADEETVRSLAKDGLRPDDGTVAGDAERECIHCDGPVTHKHTRTGELLCCGHASQDIDAKPINDGHSCEKFYTVERIVTESLCEHYADYPSESLASCKEIAEWRITTSRFPGDPVDPLHPGAPTATRYCSDHFADRLGKILTEADGAKLEVRPRDW